jgi:two-component system, NtrC family, response regulator AtoC
MNKRKILIVDDEPGSLKVISANLKIEGYEVDVSLSAKEALIKLKTNEFDLILLDVQMPEMNGLQFLKVIRDEGNDVPVIIITAYATVQDAVNAMNNGAYNYLTKPVNYEELLILCRQVFERKSTELKLKILQQECSDKYGFDNIVGKNHLMQKLYNLIKSVSDTDVPILIQGETGTGKEIISKAIHYNSNRKEKGFYIVDCATLSANLIESELFGHEKGAFTSAVNKKIGKFEHANGGTLFLDEINNISLDVQAKLLRCIEQQEIQRVGSNENIKIDVRIIAATNNNIMSDVKDKKFREDLFYRLNVIPINIPPLRDRSDDIPFLVQHFLNEFSTKYNKEKPEISTDLLSKFMNYEWPGNVRELEHIIERLIILSTSPVLDAVNVSILFPTKFEIQEDQQPELFEFKVAKETFEMEYIKKVLKYCKGNIGDSSKISNIRERNLYEKMKKYNLNKDDFKN